MVAGRLSSAEIERLGQVGLLAGDDLDTGCKEESIVWQERQLGKRAVTKLAEGRTWVPLLPLPPFDAHGSEREQRNRSISLAELDSAPDLNTFERANKGIEC